MKEYRKVLTIAGSDSSGGAGIQADIKTISACGCYASSAITALTAQNTLGVDGISPTSGKFVYKQIKAVMSDIGTDAAKIGMLFNAEIIDAVCQAIDDFYIPNLVIDPVMLATSGAKLLETQAIETIIKTLLPKAILIAPNIPEAEIIYGEKIESHDIGNLTAIAEDLSKRYNIGVLIKGGHSVYIRENKQSIDILASPELEKPQYFSSDFIETQNTHGTGCTLSAAIASGLAKGNTLSQAVANAKTYLSNAIKFGAEYKIGKGHGPVKHFWEM